MNERDYLAERFEEHRTHLRAVAYRMLGSPGEVDDAVQEAWLRLSRTDTTGIENLGGWLTTVVARVCLDMLRSRQSRREEPFTPESPEPVATGTPGSSPEQEMMIADQVGLALLVVLDKLDPAERVAFVLHDMCSMAFDEIAPIVSRSTDATRQLASRARRRVQGSRPPETDITSQRHVINTFVTALKAGDVAGLLAILAPGVVLRSSDVTGTESELRGAETVATTWAKGAAAFKQFAHLMEVALVDGHVGLVMAPKGRMVRALRFTFEDGRIATAEILASRESLDALDVAALDVAAVD